MFPIPGYSRWRYFGWITARRVRRGKGEFGAFGGIGIGGRPPLLSRFVP
jgi:hypothetical protein